MRVETKIAQNTVVQVIGRGIAISIALITLAVTTRYLGTDGYGAYITIITFLQIVAIVAELGIQMTSVQSISEIGVDENKILSNIFSIRVISSLFALLITPLIVFFFPYPAFIKIGVVICAISFFVNSLSSVFVGVFQKKMLMGRYALTDIIQKTVFLAGTLLVIYFDLNLFGILIVLIIANISQFLSTFYFSQKLIKISWQIDFSVWKKLMVKSWPLAITITLNLLYFKGDTIILSLFRSQADVGLYGAPYRILEVLINIVYVFLGLLFPLMTLYYTSKNWASLKKVMQMGFDIIMIISLPLIAGVLFLGEQVMSSIAGEDFLVSGQILKVLIFATIAIFFASLLGYLIVAANQQKRMIKFYVVNAVISLIAHLIFIPIYGFWAAAVITVFSEAFVLIACIYMVRKLYKFSPNYKLTLKALASTLAMSVVLYFVSGFHILFTLTVASLSYLATLYLLKGFSKKMILEIMNFKKEA